MADAVGDLEAAARDAGVGFVGVLDGNDWVGASQMMSVGSSAARWRRFDALTAWPLASITARRVRKKDRRVSTSPGDE